MAKAERKNNPFGWIILGILVGVVATAGVLLMASSMNVGRGYQEGPAELRTAADAAAATAPIRPALAGAPKPEAPPTPVATIPAPTATAPQPVVDDQMAEDAAAAGMTSRADPEQPTN